MVNNATPNQLKPKVPNQTETVHTRPDQTRPLYYLGNSISYIVLFGWNAFDTKKQKSKLLRSSQDKQDRTDQDMY